MPFDLGAVVPLGTSVTDAAGAPANAGNMALTIGLPDETTVTVDPVTPASTGQYAYDYTSVQSGRHTVRWLATGINPGAYTDVFVVREAAALILLSLADAKRLVKKQDSADDDLVRFWLEASTRAVEWFVGPVVVRTVTEDHHVGLVDTLALRKTPAIELVSVDPLRVGGVSYDVDDLTLDAELGIVARRDGGPIQGPVRVVVRVGRHVPGANILAAYQLIFQHLWRTQAGPGRPQRGADDYDVTEPIPGLGYAIPNRAVQLMNPDDQGPGIA
ncbi:hypothetical protein [Streptomyces sp. LN245]|uniref:hypothetical protein n=1 Tax=Streptomyces sp. LN245 TaxID=3112975 RepID=UPI0037156BB6